jgi:hypothetical protein
MTGIELRVAFVGLMHLLPPNTDMVTGCAALGSMDNVRRSIAQADSKLEMVLRPAHVGDQNHTYY